MTEPLLAKEFDEGLWKSGVEDGAFAGERDPDSTWYTLKAGDDKVALASAMPGPGDLTTISYFVHPDHREKGYGTKIASQVTDLHEKATFTIFKDNEASIKVAIAALREKFSMTSGHKVIRLTKEAAAPKPTDVLGLLKRAAERIMKRSEKPLSDKMMKSMIPMFVDSDKPDDHKCGGCNMRCKENGAESCIIVKGGISYRLGTCAFWAKGPASHWSKIHEDRMNYAVSGYIEVPEGVKVNCGACRVYDDRHCMLWNGTVKEGQCCVAYSNPQEYVPKQGQPGKPE